VKVTNVRMVLASKADAVRGLVGYVSFRLDRVQVDGVTLRRTRGGELRLVFPARRDRRGRSHPFLWPIDAATHRAIEAQVFEAVRLAEGAP